MYGVSRLGRWSGAAGFGFVVLFIAGIAVGSVSLAGAMATTGSTSIMPESAEQMVDVVSQARVGLGVSAYLLSLAAVAFVVFGWGLAAAMRRGHPDGALWMLALAGAVLYAAHILGWVSVLRQGFFLAVSDAAAATAVDTMMRGPYDKILWSPDWMFPGILLIGATGLAGRTGTGLPRSLSRVSVVFAGALIVLAALGDVLLTPLSWLGFPIFVLVWVPWVSIVLLRGVGTGARSPVPRSEPTAGET